MAASPRYKIYRGSEYIGACKFLEDAAMLMQGAGDTIRLGHKKILWTELVDGIAAESYDNVAAIGTSREDGTWRQNTERSYSDIVRDGMDE